MSGLFSNTTSTAAANNTHGETKNDVALNQPPDDSISSMMFSPQSEHLAVASWDKKVRIYEIASNGQSQGKALFEHQAPVLSCCWSPDGKQVVGAGADKAARLLDLGSGATTATQVAEHAQAIRSARFVTIANANAPVLVTGSWDKTVKYWDLRSPNPGLTLDCQDRIYTMDSKNQLLVIGLADRYINVVDLSEPQKFFKTLQSPLKWQTRVVSCFTDATGFAVGSIEGRCAIHYVDDKQSQHNFSFKCHRNSPPGSTNTSNVYSVNDINFHPEHGTFSTAGSDGTFHFWDKDAKHRLKGYPETGGTISSTCFNRNGTIFAYAVSYDWSKGYSLNTPELPNKIMLHAVQEDECKPRKAGARK